MDIAIGVLRAVDAEFTQTKDDSLGEATFLGEFLSCETFQGRKPGYVFRIGTSGLGYYVDPVGTLAYRDVQVKKPVKDSAQLLEEAEGLADALADLENIDDRGIRKVVAGLDRRVKKNQELRIKYSDAPEKFMESELEVDEIVQKLVALAGEPELYKQLVQQGCVPLLLELLHHANLDIVCNAVDFFQELLDSDVVEDMEEESQLLVDAMLEASAVDLMTQRLVALKEKASIEEESAAHNILMCFQSMVEIDGKVAAALGANDELFKWLLQRLNPRVHREFTATKGTAAETLAIMVQAEESNRVKLMKLGGVNAVLVAIEPYRKLKADLKEKEEEEYVHELCNIVGACLAQPAVKDQFLEDQGVELMLLLARGKRTFRLGAIKVLNYATTDCAKAAERVIDHKGLPCLFGAFMGRKKTKGVKAGTDDATQEIEHMLCIICNLLHNTPKGVKWDRVAAKFVENEFEKSDRLMELFFNYTKSLEQAMARLEETHEDVQEIIDLTLQTSGKFMMEQICVMFGQLWMRGDPLLRGRLLQLLHQHSVSLGSIRSQLEDVYTGIEDGTEKGKASLMRNKIGKLIAALGGTVAHMKAAAASSLQAPPLPSDNPAPPPQEPQQNPAPHNNTSSRTDAPPPGMKRHDTDDSEELDHQQPKRARFDEPERLTNHRRSVSVEHDVNTRRESKQSSRSKDYSRRDREGDRDEHVARDTDDDRDRRRERDRDGRERSDRHRDRSDRGDSERERRSDRSEREQGERYKEKGSERERGRDDRHKEGRDRDRHRSTSDRHRAR